MRAKRARRAAALVLLVAVCLGMVAFLQNAPEAAQAWSTVGTLAAAAFAAWTAMSASEAASSSAAAARDASHALALHFPPNLSVRNLGPREQDDPVLEITVPGSRNLLLKWDTSDGGYYQVSGPSPLRAPLTGIRNDFRGGPENGSGWLSARTMTLECVMNTGGVWRAQAMPDENRSFPGRLVPSFDMQLVPPDN